MSGCSLGSQNGGLFLLEVLVDKVTFTQVPCFADKDFRTCISIECPCVAMFEICDDEPSNTASNNPFVKAFNNGKSVLFSMKESDISSAKSKFPIAVTVFKSLPCGCIPSKIVMGCTVIDMSKEFAQARDKFMSDPSTISYEALKDAFQLTGPDGCDAGKIVMYLRISCFGKLIITKFQGVGATPSLGSGVGGATPGPGPAATGGSGHAMQSLDDPCACGASFGYGQVGGTGGAKAGGQMACAAGQDLYTSMPCSNPQDPCYCCGPNPFPPEKMACRNTGPYCLHAPRDRSKPLKFEEIGTKVHGCELKIKVPATAAVTKKISQTHCSLMRPYENPSNEHGEGPCLSPCGKNQISLALPTEPVCCRGPRPTGTLFTCTTEGCLQAGKHNQSPPPLVEQPHKHLYVFKVAKSAVEGDRKCRVELEMVAPKGDERRMELNEMMFDNTTQAQFDYCCPPGNKVVFQLPQDSCSKGHQQRMHFDYTSEGIGDMSREDPAALVPRESDAYKGVVNNFTHEAIKLRVGKTIIAPNYKSSLEYKFVTPVPPKRPHVITKDTRQAQCLPTCGSCCRCHCKSCMPK